MFKLCKKVGLLFRSLSQKRYMSQNRKDTNRKPTTSQLVELEKVHELQSFTNINKKTLQSLSIKLSSTPKYKQFLVSTLFHVGLKYKDFSLCNKKNMDHFKNVLGELEKVVGSLTQKRQLSQKICIFMYVCIYT